MSSSNLIEASTRDIAIDRLKSWIVNEYGCGKLCQFKWHHNRAEPVFFNYPIYVDGYDNTLSRSVDEPLDSNGDFYSKDSDDDSDDESVYRFNYGNIATPENLVNIEVDVKGYFDIVAIHTGIPTYCFNVVYDLTPLDAETFNLYKDMAKENGMLNIYHIRIDDILYYKRRPVKLKAKLMFSRTMLPTSIMDQSLII